MHSKNFGGNRNAFALVVEVLLVVFALFPFALVSIELLSVDAVAQTIPPPDRDYLFSEDRDRRLKRDFRSQRSAEIERKKKVYQQAEKSGKLPFNVSAKTINYDRTGTKLLAEGGLIITYSSMILEAMNGTVDLTANRAEVSDQVRITDVTGSIVADSAEVNLKDGSGTIKNADIHFAEGDFHIKAKEAGRTGDETYILKDTTLTTCQCADDENCAPWRIRAGEGKIVKNGYGQVWDATLEVFDVPVFYTPYLLFPAKSERQSGLLPATFGQGRTGFELELPFYWAIDDSSDMTLRPVMQTRARYGGVVDYREMFSEKSNIKGQFLYFDETMRDGKALGSNVSVLEGDDLPINRFGGVLSQNWRGDVAGHEFQTVIDGHAVSDDLLLREYERTDIAPYNSPYLTSRAALRTKLPADFSFELAGEYNQRMSGSDSLVFQRLPEAQVNGLHIFRPFGENDLGLKMVSSSTVDATNFTRIDQYTGARYEAYQSLKFPFHLRNIFDAQFEGNVRASQYSLSETEQIIADPANPGQTKTIDLKDSSDRVVPGFNAKIGSVLEKVIDLDDDSFIKGIAELGRVGRSQELKRLKHTLEPTVSYRLVPQVDQSENPLFDSYDRLAQRNVMTYGLTQRIFGRYEPRNQYLYGIEEVTPSLRGLGNLRGTGPIDDKLGFGVDDVSSADFQRLRIGSLKELASFKLSQSYNFITQDATTGDELDPYSDVLADMTLFPNEYVALHGRTNFNVQDRDFTSYMMEGQLQNKRGDQIRARFDVTGQTVRQLHSNIEFGITDYTRIGHYATFEAISGKFTENRAGLRFLSSCKCWTFDMDVIDKINPDQTSFLVGITLVGLGELNQRVMSSFSGAAGSSSP